jgi:hypothetical protein
MDAKKSALTLMIILIFGPFLRAETDPSPEDSLNPGISVQEDSLKIEIGVQPDSPSTEVASRTDSMNIDVASRPDSLVKGNDIKPSFMPYNNSAVRSEPRRKVVYLVCVARYSTRASAEKHSESLRLFGYAPWIQVKGEKVFLVVLEKTDERPKAEKMKSKYEKRGLTSFIEES